MPRPAFHSSPPGGETPREGSANLRDLRRYRATRRGERTARGEKAETAEKNIERLDWERLEERQPRTLFGSLVDFAQELECEMEAIGVHPCDAGAAEAGGHRWAQRRADLRNLGARPLVRIDGNKQTRHAVFSVSQRRIMSIAACDAWNLTISRPPTKLNVLTRVSHAPSCIQAAAIMTVPTGFSGVPPEGPAIPVTPTARSLPEMRRTLVAIASATGSLTAP